MPMNMEVMDLAQFENGDFGMDDNDGQANSSTGGGGPGKMKIKKEKKAKSGMDLRIEQNKIAWSCKVQTV